MKPQTQLGRMLVAGLCVLVAIFMCVQLAHNHQLSASGDNPAHCQLCLLTHVVAVPVALAALFVARQMLLLVLCGMPQRGSPAVALLYRIRPPPASI